MSRNATNQHPQELTVCEDLYNVATQRLHELDIDSDIADAFLNKVCDGFATLVREVLDKITQPYRLAALRSFNPNLADGLSNSLMGTFDQRLALRDAGRALFLKLRAAKIEDELKIINGH